MGGPGLRVKFTDDRALLFGLEAPRTEHSGHFGISVMVRGRNPVCVVQL